MIARIKLAAHCLWQLLVTLWTQKAPHKHGEVLATHTNHYHIGGFRFAAWRYTYQGCVCGRVFFEEPGFKEENPELAEFVRKCVWDKEDKQ